MQNVITKKQTNNKKSDINSELLATEKLIKDIESSIKIIQEQMQKTDITALKLSKLYNKEQMLQMELENALKQWIDLSEPNNTRGPQKTIQALEMNNVKNSIINKEYLLPVTKSK